MHLAPAQLEQLYLYHQLLREHNSELNLTRIRNFANMVLKLYVDSILPGELMELPSPLLDLGTGPGMPGIPLQIAYPELRVVLAESRQKRVQFLLMVAQQLRLPNLQVIGKGITPAYEEPVAGVITRAVERMEETLARVRGCLAGDGLAIFMKGPNCEEEIAAAGNQFRHAYRLLHDLPYRIPTTPHERRLVVWQRLDRPLRVLKKAAMERHRYKKIDSDQNNSFKELHKLLTSHGIKKQGRALVAGTKQVTEILQAFPHRCLAWISSGDQTPPPAEAPEHLIWYQLAPPLFNRLDGFGTHVPLLLVETQAIVAWQPQEGFPEGCSVLVPFQDPENVGAMIRSAVAFGATQIILLEESAHPYHPKALRASGGAVFHARLRHGPSLQELSKDLPLVALSAEGKDISAVGFPPRFGLLPGMEGSGLPEHLRQTAVSIPISSRVESLNAAAATAIALYLWSRSDKTSDHEK